MTDCSRPDCTATREALTRELAYRTLGGTPPPSDAAWANATLPPPESASDESAPALRRDEHSGYRPASD